MKRKIIIWMIVCMVCLTATVSAAGLQKAPSLSRLFFGGSNQEADDGGRSHLPSNIFAVRGVFHEQTKGDVEIVGSGEADSDFLNTLSHGKLGDRNKNMNYEDRITEANGVSCSVNPDFTRAITTKSSTYTLCYQNQYFEGVVFRLWDIDSGVTHIGDKLALENGKTCFSVEPDHQYLYDILYCTPQSCNCNYFKNEYCSEVNGTIKMMRVRDCSPDNCDIETLWVDWVDTSVDNCDKVTKYCHETDGGLDYTHYGQTIKGDDYRQDRCVDGTKMKEYYCDNDVIQSKFHYCQENQICHEGECIPKDEDEEDCGTVNDKKRYEGDVWCVGKVRRQCNEGKIVSVDEHPECAHPKCDYSGILFNEGEKVCMNNGITIAECFDPNSTDEMFNYENCHTGTECSPNSRSTVCNEVPSTGSSDLQDQPPKKYRTILEWLFSLLGDKK